LPEHDLNFIAPSTPFGPLTRADYVNGGTDSRKIRPVQAQGQAQGQAQAKAVTLVPNLTRRAFLASLAVFLQATPASAAKDAKLWPDRPPVPVALSTLPDPAAGGRVQIEAEGLPVMRLPGKQICLLGLLPVGNRDIIAAGISMEDGSGTELLAFAGWDGGCARLLGLEVLTWAAANQRLDTRVRASPDGCHVCLIRTLAVIRTAPGATAAGHLRPPFRLVWNEWLRWQDHAPLADAHLRPTIPDGMPARFAIIRAKVARLLAQPRTELTTSDLEGTGLLRPDFPVV
jgi:hypothetical protein